MRRSFAVAGMLLGILASHASAADTAPKLFKDYAYGEEQKNYEGKKEFYDCAEEFGTGALCKDGVQFMGRDFTAVLGFSDKKLTRVSLFTESDQELFNKLIGGISQTFTLISLSDGKSQLDILHTLKSDPQAKVVITNFESAGISGGNFTYTFLENLNSVAKSDSVYDAVEKAPMAVRSADLMVVGEGPETALVLKFSMPKQEARKIKEAHAKPTESF